MENNYHKEITIVIILYKEEANLLLSCLENINQYKIIFWKFGNIEFGLVWAWDPFLP